MAILTARIQRFFHVFILSTTSEKSFIPYKASATVQALKDCPVRPRVSSSWGMPRVLSSQKQCKGADASQVALQK